MLYVATPGRRSRWGETPKWGETPRADGGETPGRTSGWGETPRADRSGGVSDTPTPHGGKRRSRWDETPVSQRQSGGVTPQVGHTPSSILGATPNFSGKTPAGVMAMGLQTPSAGKKRRRETRDTYHVCTCTIIHVD